MTAGALLPSVSSSCRASPFIQDAILFVHGRSNGAGRRRRGGEGHHSVVPRAIVSVFLRNHARRFSIVRHRWFNGNGHKGHQRRGRSSPTRRTKRQGERGHFRGSLGQVNSRILNHLSRTTIRLLRHVVGQVSRRQRGIVRRARGRHPLSRQRI